MPETDLEAVQEPVRVITIPAEVRRRRGEQWAMAKSLLERNLDQGRVLAPYAHELMPVRRIVHVVRGAGTERGTVART